MNKAILVLKVTGAVNEETLKNCWEEVDRFFASQHEDLIKPPQRDTSGIDKGILKVKAIFANMTVYTKCILEVGSIYSRHGLSLQLIDLHCDMIGIREGVQNAIELVNRIQETEPV